jgi:hypothetical protein
MKNEKNNLYFSKRILRVRQFAQISSYCQLREAHFVSRNIHLRWMNQGYIHNLKGRAKRVTNMLVSKIRLFTYEKNIIHNLKCQTMKNHYVGSGVFLRVSCVLKIQLDFIKNQRFFFRRTADRKTTVVLIKNHSATVIKQTVMKKTPKMKASSQYSMQRSTRPKSRQRRKGMKLAQRRGCYLKIQC